jgi:hypothetical protein
MLLSVKLQSIVGPGPFTEVDQTTAENKFWYRFRPQETINELNVMKVVRKDLEGCTTSYWHLLKGISLRMIRW